MSVKKVPGAKVISNYSFKTRKFKLSWSFVNTKDINVFTARSLSDIKEKIQDTLTCQLRGKNYRVIVAKEEKDFVLWFYEDRTGIQMVLVALVKKEENILPVMEYMQSHLQ